MLQNNNQRLNIWLSLTNKFDYKEMLEACVRADVPLFTAFEFAQKAGMLSCAKVLFPDLSEEKAYLQFISIYNSQVVQQTTSPVVDYVATAATPCAGCGGGTIK